MTLRNAFEDMATEATLKGLTASINELVSTIARQSALYPPRTLQYARTVSDAMRVNIENQSNINAYNTNNGSASPAGAGAAPTMWANNTWNYVDARQPLAEQQQLNFSMSRNRWVFS